jgi:hypothetical protein
MNDLKNVAESKTSKFVNEIRISQKRYHLLNDVISEIKKIRSSVISSIEADAIDGSPKLPKIMDVSNMIVT